MRKSGTLVSVLRYRFVRVYLILNNVVLNNKVDITTINSVGFMRSSCM